MATIKQKINQIISFLKNKLNSFSQTKFMEKVKKFFEKGDRKFVLQLYLIAIGVFLLLFLYCACVISSKCSREEEKDEQFRKIQNVIK